MPDVFDAVTQEEKKKDIFDSLPSGDIFDQVGSGEDYLKRVTESNRQPLKELSPEEKARTGQLYAEPGEVTGGVKENDPFTGKVAIESPLVSSDAIERTLLGDAAVDNPNRSPTDKAISKAVMDRLSGMTSEKFASTLPMYAIPGYAEAQGLEGISQSVPELKQGIKEGDPGKITGGTLDSIIAALMLGHRAIPNVPRRTSAIEDGVSRDLQPAKPETPTPQGETTIPQQIERPPIQRVSPETGDVFHDYEGRPEPTGITETLAELKRRNVVTPGEVALPQDSPQPMESNGAPVEDVGAGISQARTEAELGEGSVEPGVGAELGSGLEYGRNYINKGGDPRLPIRRALTSGLVGKNEVGIVHAELERLRGERNVAASALEANPGDLVAKGALDAADAAQRAWRKELQPVLTKASDALREAYTESAVKPDVGTYQGLADLMDQHFDGARDLTPLDRTKLQQAAKGVRDVRAETRSAVDRASAQVARRTRRIMSPDELKADLADVLKDAFKDCVL